MLSKLTGFDAPDTWKRRIADIVDLEVDDQTRKVTSKTLGIRKVSYNEAGAALEFNDGVRGALDKLFGIHTHIRPFLPRVPYSQQLRSIDVDIDTAAAVAAEEPVGSVEEAPVVA